jgi:hypothetical protein
MSGMVIATITLWTPPPKMAITASARTISGKAITTSNTRCSKRSRRPPK